MTLKTVPVRILAELPDGTAAARACITAQLVDANGRKAVPSFDAGVIVPAKVGATADDAGSALLHLWPNQRGAVATLYRVIATQGEFELLNVTIAVPDSDPTVELPIKDLVNQPPWPAVDAAQQAVQTAQAAAAAARSVSGALLFTFDNATADADPGAGKLRLNNATLSAVTEAYVDNTEQGGADVSAIVDILDDSTGTTKAFVVLREGSTGKVATYRIGGSVVNGSGYRKLQLVWIGGSTGGFTHDHSLGFSFSISGDNGNAVAAGSNTQVQYNDGGVIAGSSNLTWNKATNTLMIAGIASITGSAAAPTFTTRSTGTRVILNATLSAVQVDAAFGVNSLGPWFSCGAAGTSWGFTWYAGTTTVASLDGSGALYVQGNISCGTTGNARLITRDGADGFTTGFNLGTSFGTPQSVAAGSYSGIYSRSDGRIDLYAGTGGSAGGTVTPLLALGATAATFAPKLDLTAGQIKFPATQVPSSDPNTLDDYEEGTFTPLLTFGGGAVGLSYSAQDGEYTKVGRAVHFRASIRMSAKGSSTGDAVLSGLPFVQGTTGFTALHVLVTLMSGITTPINAYIVGAVNSATLAQGFNSLTNLTQANFTDTSIVMVSGTYFV